MKYDNIEKVRNYLLNMMEQVEKGKADLSDLVLNAKSMESVFQSVKLQLAYSNMLGDTPNIPFLDDCHNGTPKTKQLKGDE